ncbi:MAG: N-acetylmuramoyl-L-alanine amidase [Kiritimatiellaeota bacterium]|nr:N-acetylmuramoyl-L-alanine amidase [Kiritimatiellota bacterium]
MGFWFCATAVSAALNISNAYYSPRNKERSVRKETQLIILHTTEAPSKSALPKLRDMGECHYCLDEAGRVYRIIDSRRVAFHSGRSMWNGKSDVDNFSVGIEVCGYHNKPLSPTQMRALAELIGELRRMYKIPDYNVLAHSHVAYGIPNKWQTKNHRGRKRCGMLFAMPSIRAQLGLKLRPLKDPDVAAKRLVIGDPELAQVLYGALSAFQLGAAAPQAQVPLPPPPPPKPTGPYATIGVNGTARDIVGVAVWSPSVFYIYPDGKYKSGDQITAEEVLKLPYGTKVLQGYAIGGPVLASSPPSAICGNRWRASTTFYLISGTLTPGDKVDDKKIPAGTMLFFKKN